MEEYCNVSHTDISHLYSHPLSEEGIYKLRHQLHAVIADNPHLAYLFYKSHLTAAIAVLIGQCDVYCCNPIHTDSHTHQILYDCINAAHPLLHCLALVND